MAGRRRRSPARGTKAEDDIENDWGDQQPGRVLVARAGRALKLQVAGERRLCGNLIIRQVPGLQMRLEISSRQRLGVEIALRLLALLLQ